MDRYLIGLDWGISSFRAYLMDDKGRAVDSCANQDGILRVGNRSFEAALEASVGHWMDRYPDAPLIACGMIGSRQGWLEAPYVNCPAGLMELVKNLCVLKTQKGRKIWFVPGVMRRDQDNIPDVMRGEETQIFGGVQNDAGRESFILPGTHSKWALVQEGSLVWFSTFMTGELFAVLCEHSILGRLMEASEDDDEAFIKGLEFSSKAFISRQGLLNRLFSVRSLGLFNEMPKTGLKSYLSGLLIGAEVAEATWQIKEKTVLRLVGQSRLSILYEKALRFFGWPSVIDSENLAACGLALIAKNADLQ